MISPNLSISVPTHVLKDAKAHDLPQPHKAAVSRRLHRARSLGLNYVRAADGALNLTFDDILHRFGILTRRGTADSASEVSAVLVELLRRSSCSMPWSTSSKRSYARR